MGHTATITDTGIRIEYRVGVLAHRVTLAGECSLVDLEVDGHHDATVGGHSIAGLDDHEVTGHQVDGRDRLNLTVASNAGGR